MGFNSVYGCSSWTNVNKRLVLKLESVLLHMLCVSVYFGRTVRNELLFVRLSARMFRSSGLTLVSFGIDEVRR